MTIEMNYNVTSAKNFKASRNVVIKSKVLNPKNEAETDRA
jgi:hypothetical protein